MSSTEPDVQSFVRQLSQEYSDLSFVDNSTDLQSLQDVVDTALSKIEEYCTFLEHVKKDTSLCIETSLPILKEEASRIKDFYAMIDRLESVVKCVKSTVDQMDQAVAFADEMFPSPGFKVPKVLSSLIGARKKPFGRLDYVAPPIFRTELLFDHKCEQGSEVYEEDDMPPKTFNVSHQ